jgi:hypothetical protein
MELKHKSFFVLLAIIVGIFIGIAVWKFLGPTLGMGIFYYKVEGSEANLFLLKNSHSKKLISLPAREIDPGDFRPPKRSYLSNSRKEMVYFKQVDEVPVEDAAGNQEFIVNKIVYKPILVNLKNGKEIEISQLIDSAGLVFSPNDEKIAWIKQVDEATYTQIEQSGKRREIMISDKDGKNSESLISFEENLIILKKWAGDYIYFQGLWDVYTQSLGRVNIKTKQVEYLIPQGCAKSLENCKNIEFAPSGNKFLYEIISKKDDKDITELYLGDFDKNEFLAVLTTDQIGNRVWVDDGEVFFYTEQEVDKFDKVIETIHLVNIKNQTDDSVYSGNYISQLTFDLGGRYLYFIEKQQEGENFNLMRFDLKIKKAEVLLTENYNKILLIQ